MPPRCRLDACEQALELFLSPEEAAILDAALEGEARLHAHHIKRLTDGKDLPKHMERLGGDIETRVRHKAIAVRCCTPRPRRLASSASPPRSSMTRRLPFSPLVDSTQPLP